MTVHLQNIEAASSIAELTKAYETSVKSIKHIIAKSSDLRL